MKSLRIVLTVPALISAVFFTAACQPAWEHTTITEKDYQRAEEFLSHNLGEKVYGLEVNPTWILDTSSFWYQVNTREGKTFYRVCPENRLKEPAFDHKKMAQMLSEKTGRVYTREDLPFDRIKYIEDKKIEFTVNDRIWTADLDTYTYNLAEKEKDEEEELETPSPDGKWAAFRKENDLYIRSKENGREIRLSRSGRPLYKYAGYLGWGDIMEGENGERPEHFSVKWSPDSKKIYTQILDLRKARKMFLLKSVNEDFRAQLLSYYRASPGDTDIAYYLPVIFDIETRKEIKINVDPVPHFLGFDAHWFEDARGLYARWFDRGYKTLNFAQIDPDDGDVRIIIKDENETCIETGISRYRMLEKSKKLIITSERDGWNHLYLFDWENSDLISQVTAGEFVVLNITHVDEENESIYFQAAGLEINEDPYLRHLYRVNFDGSGLESLTPEHAYHDVSLSPRHDYFVDNYSRVDMPTISVLRSLENGSVIMELEQADIKDILAMGWTFPEPFQATAADGETKIYGLMWKPSNFNKNKSYPVIDQSYTGPQAVVTPKTFRRALMHSNTALAELQFIPITVDGRGTAQRSKEFHNFTYKNLGGGVTDHIPAIRQLAADNPYMDTDRVGIYGHSAGGYDTARALLNWPEFYKVGVSSSGNHDHRMAKAWWPEQYMGYPVGDFYSEQSNINNADRLQGKLLLVHGEIDENVNPSATIRFVDALIKHNKDFDLLIFPDNRHGYRGVYSDYFTRKRWDYFVRHLHNTDPPYFKISRLDEDD